MQKNGRGFLPRAAKAIDGWSEFTGYLSGFFILAASLVIAEAVFARKVLGESTSWQGEMAVYLLMAAAFIGASYTQKHEGHIGVDLVTSHLPLRVHRVIDIAGSILGLIVTVVIARYAWPMWWQAIKYNEHSETMWGPHLGFPYIIIPLGMTFLALQYLVRIGRKLATPGVQDAVQAGPDTPPDAPVQEGG
jgi:TRAP-type C4-dicarboxylate transport system permease small subunit